MPNRPPFNTSGLATTTSPGLVGTGAQTFAGAKTFQDGIVAPSTAVGTVYSGTYTPTFTAVSGGAAGTPGVCQFMRIGKCVTVSGTFSLSYSPLNNVEFRLTIPIARTANFSATTNAGGCGVWARGGVTVGGVAFTCCAYVSATNQVTLSTTSPSGTGTADVFSFQFTYLLD